MKFTPPILRKAATVLLPGLLGGCANLLPALAVPPTEVSAPTPSAWAAPAPQAHGGALPKLQGWWQQWNDPLLLDLMGRAQQASPSVAAAATRVAQARHEAVAAGASASPSVQGSVGVSRAISYVDYPIATQASAGLQARWELDLMGGLAAAQRGVADRLSASEAQWHDARVAVAAEVARQYTGWRACQQTLHIAQADTQARESTARLVQAQASAGMQAPAQAALAPASAAQGRMQTIQQASRCDASLKALVALTDSDEALLRQRLAPPAGSPGHAAAAREWMGPALPSAAQLPPPPTLPAVLLAQRPDVFSAQKAVAAASADVGVAEADRYPRLSLSGQIAAVGTRGAGGDGPTWSIGPLQLSLPLLDGGLRTSQATLARARYDETVVAYQATVRGAVREVEQALLELHSIAQREADADLATQGFARALQATTERQRAGLANLLELEDTRRSALSAQLTLTELARDRVLAWVDLYRAYGGGWQAPAPSTPTTLANAPSAFARQP